MSETDEGAVKDGGVKWKDSRMSVERWKQTASKDEEAEADPFYFEDTRQPWGEAEVMLSILVGPFCGSSFHVGLRTSGVVHFNSPFQYECTTVNMKEIREDK
jgi:hypothetical protein